MSNQLTSFNDLGMLRTTSNVDNEVHVFRSVDNMHDVVLQMNLQYDYTVKGRLRTQTLYKKNLPLTVEIEGLDENDFASLVLDIDGENVSLSEMNKNKSKYTTVSKGKFDNPISTPIGIVKVSHSDIADKIAVEKIYVTRYPLKSVITMCMKKLNVALADKMSDVITLTYTDVVPERAADVLKTLIEVYNFRWVENKNVVTRATSKFIHERLALIEHELSGVDEKISQYQSANMIPDIKEAASMYMQQSNKTSQQILELNNQLETCKYLRSFLDGIDDTQLIPSITGIGADGIQKQISDYNEMVMKRNRLAMDSSTENKIVQDMDEQISALRQTISQALNNQNIAINTQINNLRRSESTTNSKIENSPRQAKILLSVERQQSVKQSLYIFLLQKLEENELSQAFTAYNTRIVEWPAGNDKPVSPKKLQIFAIALILGLAIPISVIYLREQLSTKVRGKRDIQGILSMPYLGEIPQMMQKEKFSLRKHKQTQYKTQIAVRKGSRDAINEAFRVLRTNIEFVTTEDNKVSAVTSYNVGSGKTFVTINLGVSFAINDKKVLIMDCDIRKANISRYIGSPKPGLTDYLAKKIDDYHNAIVQYPDYQNLYILPCGTIPPNPTELISSVRFANLMDEVRNEYDYILIDCPPIDIVADPQIVNKYVDRTMFVIRAGLLEKSILNEIEEYYQSDRYKNMALILNGTKGEGGKYGYRYGYRYGGYGRGYGYHDTGKDQTAK
ncbi:MAG: polysaccharide biosynthesis tyrosine autokinase [Bacteroidaceae bacterium]|nr:polysaccharide biosynthesis tyrosine autokinase [Bacteroidaceae bacterium]